MARVKMINSLGGTTWVTEERVEEYKAAGHKLAASPATPKEEEKADTPLVKELKEEKKAKRK